MKAIFRNTDIRYKRESQSIQHIQYNNNPLFVIFFTSYKEKFYLETKNNYICIKEFITQLRTACTT